MATAIIWGRGRRVGTGRGRRGPRLAALAMAGAALLGAGSLGAQEASEGAPLIADRPDFTESTNSVAPGRFQLETGYTFARDGDLREHTVGEVLLRIGVLTGVELRVGLNSFVVVEHDDPRDAEGFEDVVLGAKLELPLPAGGWVPAAALLGSLSLPTGEDEVGGTDGVQPEAVLALGWDLAPRLSLGLNGGYGRLKEEGERFDQFSHSAALGFDVGRGVGLFLEYFALRPLEDRSDENTVNGGVTWLLTPNLQLDARAGLGLEGADPDYFTGVGLSVRW